MLGLGAPELIIVLLILLLLFGASRLPKLSKSLGESARELRKGFTDDPHKKEEEKKGNIIEYPIFLVLRNLLKLTENEFDYVIIDNSPYRNIFTSMSICASDVIYSPIRPDFLSYEGLSGLITEIEYVNKKYNLSVEFGGAFLNGIKKRTTIYRLIKDKYVNRIAIKFLNTSIRDDTAASESNTVCVPLPFYRHNSNAVLDYIELFKEAKLLTGKDIKNINQYIAKKKVRK